MEFNSAAFATVNWPEGHRINYVFEFAIYLLMNDNTTENRLMNGSESLIVDRYIILFREH